MRLVTQFAASVAKEDLDAPQNDDSLRALDKRQRWCVSDGASESYHPSLWSSILVDQWIKRGAGFSAARLRDAIRQYESANDCRKLTWSQQAAYERGTYATFLGVALLPQDTLRIVAIGDSLVVLTDGTEVVKSFPYTTAADFDQRPFLLATIPEKNAAFFSGGIPKKIRAKWHLCQYSLPHILCMTDALGKWFLLTFAQ
jgi:hypothetical protein